MKEIQKRPLTHWTCFRSYYPCFKLIFSILLICMAQMIMIGIFSTAIEHQMISMWILLLTFIPGPIWLMACGLELLVNTFKFLIAMSQKQYFVYLAVVSDKRIGIGDNSGGVGYGSGGGTTYYLQFKKNRYKKQVSEKEYYSAQIGEPYYLVKIIGANEAFAAFAESKYYLHKSMQKQFRQVDKNEFN